MRISDWSSDVCSSDLHLVAFALVVAAATDAVHPLGGVDRVKIGGERPRQRLGTVGFEARQRTRQLVGRGTLGAPPDRGDTHLLDPFEERLATQIGRASCRERVCHYG